MVVAGREDFLARDLEQPRQFRQGRALVIIGMAETQVNGVSLVMKFRLFLPRPVDEFGHALQLFLVLGDEPFQINYREDEAGVRTRFARWLERGLVEGLDVWRRTE